MSLVEVLAEVAWMLLALTLSLEREKKYSGGPNVMAIEVQRQLVFPVVPKQYEVEMGAQRQQPLLVGLDELVTLFGRQRVFEFLREMVMQAEK